MPTGDMGPDGKPVLRQVQRSTGVTDRSRALQIAISFERTALAAAEKRWSDEAARQFLAEVAVLTGTVAAAVPAQSMATTPALAAPSRPIDAFIGSWSLVWQRTVSPKSWLNARSVLRDFLEWLGSRHSAAIRSLTAGDIAGFRDRELSLGKSPTTVNKELSFLSQAFDEAVAQGYMDKNLARGLRIKRAKRAAQSRCAFSFDQFCELVRRTAPDERGTRGAPTHPDWQTFLIVSGYTGGRQQEVARLTWGRVDFERRRIGLVRTKTGGDLHWVPMHDSLYAHLRLRANETPARAPDDYVMPGFAGAQGRYLSKAFRELILPRIGLRQPYVKHPKGVPHGRKLAQYSIHSLRHSLPTWLNAAGVSDVMRMRIIGHDDEEVSRGYTHTDLELARKALASVPSLSRAIQNEHNE